MSSDIPVGGLPIFYCRSYSTTVGIDCLWSNIRCTARCCTVEESDIESFERRGFKAPHGIVVGDRVLYFSVLSVSSLLEHYIQYALVSNDWKDETNRIILEIVLCEVTTLRQVLECWLKSNTIETKALQVNSVYMYCMYALYILYFHAGQAV